MFWNPMQPPLESNATEKYHLNIASVAWCQPMQKIPCLNKIKRLAKTEKKIPLDEVERQLWWFKLQTAIHVPIKNTWIVYIDTKNTKKLIDLAEDGFYGSLSCEFMP